MYFCSKSSALLLLVSKWCYAMRKLLLMPRFSASGLKQTPYFLILTPILRVRCYCSDCQGGKIFLHDNLGDPLLIFVNLWHVCTP